MIFGWCMMYCMYRKDNNTFLSLDISKKRGAQFTNDSRYVIVGLESVSNRDNDSDDSDSDEKESKEKNEWTKEPCTFVFINTTTRMVRACTRIISLMFSSEYEKCFEISVDGESIGVGTSSGRLIVTDFKHLTGIYDSNNGGQPDRSENAALLKICIGNDIKNGNNSNNSGTQSRNVNNININPVKVILMVGCVQMKMLIVTPFCTLCRTPVWV